MRIYLAGSATEDWYREYVITKYGNYFDLVNPLYEEKVTVVQEAKGINETIIQIDKEAMKSCDILVAYVNYPTYGTVMEICYAKEVLDIPVYVINTSGEEMKDPWLEQYSDRWFSKIVRCFEYLKEKKERMEMREEAEKNEGKMMEEFRREEREGFSSLDDDGTGGDSSYSGIFKQISGGRYGLEDDQVATKLLDKQYSPMLIRKYTRVGFPIFVHLICDANLDDLDDEVHKCIDYCQDTGILSNSIQSLRNFTGIMSEWLDNHYNNKKKGCVESIGIIFAVDKGIISALKGDVMNHTQCKIELYQCLNLLAHV